MRQTLSLLLAAATSCLASGASYSDQYIERDVVVIGGGSSGTYTAIRLQEEKKTVALIEKQGRLGGHVDTYVDPSTGATFDYGVVIFSGALDVVRNYFASFNIPTTKVNEQGSNTSTTIYTNFNEGTKIPANPQSNLSSIATALETYLAQLAKYPYLESGYNLPSPVPSDLLLTWGEFVEKYNLDAVAYLLWQYLQGVGNILDQRALYVLKYAPTTTVMNILQNGFITTARHNNQELYNAAQARLGDDAHVNSHVTKVTRQDDGVEVHVSTPENPNLVIKARKLVITIPPKTENLQPFLDLSGEESSLFGQFNNSYYWDAVLKNTGLPDDVMVSNLNPAAPYGIPASPSLYVNDFSGLPGLRTTWYSSPYYLSDEDVKADILATTEKLVQGLGYTNDNKPEFVGFNAHNPFELTVCPDAIAKGFYTELEGLQGKRNTWWTGATWQGAPDSSMIWNYTEHKVLPGLLASL
ncbi:Flavin-containing superfamily amine oxidase [Teratosphaeria destructans]|uniref:Flavin-containing superfamily amine oxidase n=1 Tax=Teratosphaeria destructans TaxID=418781 RepID=A0A9W7SSK6_9PEZI|nr:Flavin-containing superfamily amine oxidase [Teratosphaeria destructans]